MSDKRSAFIGIHSPLFSVGIMTPPTTGASKKAKEENEEQQAERVATPGQASQPPSSASRKATGASKKSYTVQDDSKSLVSVSKSRGSTASRKTQTSMDIIERGVEKIKAKIKTGEDIDAQEVLNSVLLMLDDMRRTMNQMKEERISPEVEVITHDESEVGEKHSLMNVNVKGIKKNLAALKMFNELKQPPSFIVVTETWSQDLDQAQIPGYHEPAFRFKSKTKASGVGIYVKTQYEMTVSERVSSIEYKIKHVDVVGVEASLEDYWKILIIGVYRPTGKTPSDILKDLEIIFSVAESSKIPVIIAGDFNIDVNNFSDAMSKKYIALLQKMNIRILTREPTRVSSKGSAILDHILINEAMTSEVVASVLDVQIAEHQISVAEWY